MGIFLYSKRPPGVLGFASEGPAMNHRKVILLWIVMLLGLTLSCRRATGPYYDLPDMIWMRTYGGTEKEVGECVIETSDGGFVITGFTESYGDGYRDVILVRTDSQGETLWTKTYGGDRADVGTSVIQTSDNGFLVVGYTLSFEPSYTSKIYMIKTDENGDSTWTRILGNGAGGRCVLESSDGGYIISGYTGASFGIVYIVKTDSRGDTLWTKEYRRDDGDWGEKIKPTSDGGYIVVGTTCGHQNDSDIYILRIDENGDTLWTKTYGGDLHEEGYGVQQTNDGGFIFSGWSASTRGIYIIKTDENGDTLWTKSHDSGRAYSIYQTSDGGYMLSGCVGDGLEGSADTYLLRADINGEKEWICKYGTPDDEYGLSMLQTSDGSHVITGWTGPHFDSTDIFLMKVK
jgi:hypothetical protein